jgi:hypothetical protein
MTIPTPVTCETCEKVFILPWPSVAKKRRFCSRECSQTPMFTCKVCGERKRGRSSRQRACDECVGSKTARHRFNRYAVSESVWQEMVAKYDGQCWICRKAPAKCVDHDHDTGRVRGALCRVCNMALHYHENMQWREVADAYLAAGGR